RTRRRVCDELDSIVGDEHVLLEHRVVGLRARNSSLDCEVHPRLEQTLLALVEPQVLVAETKTVPDVWVVVLSGRDGEGSRARPNLPRGRDRGADAPAALEPA